MLKATSTKLMSTSQAKMASIFAHTCVAFQFISIVRRQRWAPGDQTGVIIPCELDGLCFAPSKSF